MVIRLSVYRHHSGFSWGHGCIDGGPQTVKYLWINQCALNVDVDCRVHLDGTYGVRCTCLNVLSENGG